MLSERYPARLVITRDDVLHRESCAQKHIDDLEPARGPASTHREDRGPGAQDEDGGRCRSQTEPPPLPRSQRRHVPTGAVTGAHSWGLTYRRTIRTTAYAIAPDAAPANAFLDAKSAAAGITMSP